MSQSPNNIVSFSEAVKQKWEADFKKRWRETGNEGDYTSSIWTWEEMLESMGWDVQLHNRTVKEFCTYVDFDNKVLLNNNPKAYHAHQAMNAALIKLFEGCVGRWLFYWEEVHDDAHRHVRDQPEWEGSELYGSVWYSMELHERELKADEAFPEHTGSISTLLLTE